MGSDGLWVAQERGPPEFQRVEPLAEALGLWGPTDTGALINYLNACTLLGFLIIIMVEWACGDQLQVFIGWRALDLWALMSVFVGFGF